MKLSRKTQCSSEKLVRGERSDGFFLHSPPPTLISLVSLRFRPPANGFVLLQTIFLNTVGHCKHVIFEFFNTLSLNSCNARVFNRHCQLQTSTSSFTWSLMLPQLSTYHSSLLMIYSIQNGHCLPSKKKMFSHFYSALFLMYKTN